MGDIDDIGNVLWNVVSDKFIIIMTGIMNMKSICVANTIYDGHSTKYIQIESTIESTSVYSRYSFPKSVQYDGLVYIYGSV